jgi:hypothetical protein
LSAHLRISVMKGERILRSGGCEIRRLPRCRATQGRAIQSQRRPSQHRPRATCLPVRPPRPPQASYHSERRAPVETPSGSKAGRQGAVQPQRSDRNAAAKTRSQRIPGRTVQIDSFSPSPIPATLDGLVDRSTKNANRFAEFRTMTHNNPCDWPKSGDQRRSVEGLCVEAASGHRVTDD